MKPLYASLIAAILSCFLLASGDASLNKETPYDLKIPQGFPRPNIPEDNALTKERVLLGKKLFFDKILSKDKSVSCSTCHEPTQSFTDNKVFSIGVQGATGERNSMPLVNLAWSNSFFWDGGVPTLELQVLKPLTSPLEMNMQLDEALRRLN
ncbi:MAG TPA: cytochrome-c peroxidase, partial [Chryseolinea sp.]